MSLGGAQPEREDPSPPYMEGRWISYSAEPPKLYA